MSDSQNPSETKDISVLIFQVAPVAILSTKLKDDMSLM